MEKHKHTNNNKVYSDGSKSEGKTVDFAVVFKDITRTGTLLEVSIHLSKMYQ